MVARAVRVFAEAPHDLRSMGCGLFSSAWRAIRPQIVCRAGRASLRASHPGERASLGQGGRARLPLPFPHPGVEQGRPLGLTEPMRLPLAWPGGGRGSGPARSENFGEENAGGPPRTPPCEPPGASRSHLSSLLLPQRRRCPQTPVDRLQDSRSRSSREGLYAGPIDGIAGPMTRRAIRVFQKRNGLARGRRSRPANPREARPARPSALRHAADAARDGRLGRLGAPVPARTPRRRDRRDRRRLRLGDETRRQALPGAGGPARGRHRRARDAQRARAQRHPASSGLPAERGRAPPTSAGRSATGRAATG